MLLSMKNLGSGKIQVQDKFKKRNENENNVREDGKITIVLFRLCITEIVKRWRKRKEGNCTQETYEKKRKHRLVMFY